MWKNRFIGILFFLTIWQMISFFYPPGIFPGIEDVTLALIDVAQEERFFRNIGDSIIRVMIGTMISLFLGTFLGIAGGMSRFIRETLYPSMVILESIPPMAWIVMAIIWFHIGNMPSIMAAIASATPIVFFNTVEGVKNINKNYLEMADVFQLSFWEKIKYIYIPSIIPVIIAAFSANFSLNWRVVIMAEALSSYTGLGQSLWGTYLFGDMQKVFAYIAVIATLGLLIEYVILEPMKKNLIKRFHLSEG